MWINEFIYRYTLSDQGVSRPRKTICRLRDDLCAYYIQVPEEFVQSSIERTFQETVSANPPKEPFTSEEEWIADVTRERNRFLSLPETMAA